LSDVLWTGYWTLVAVLSILAIVNTLILLVAYAFGFRIFW
jgi:hypothetical protein